METTITIKTIERRVGKTSGKDWWSIEASDGEKYSCHEAVIAEQFQIGQNATIEFVERSGYKNIVKLINTTAQSNTSPARSKESAKAEPFAESRKEKTASMLTSYAKDMWIADNPEADLESLAKQITAAYKQIVILLN